VEGLVKIDHLAKQFVRLPLRRRQQQDRAAGLKQGRVQGQSGDHGRFAGLPAAVQEHACFLAAKQMTLPGVNLPITEGEEQRRIKRQGRELTGSKLHDASPDFGANKSSVKKRCEIGEEQYSRNME